MGPRQSSEDKCAIDEETLDDIRVRRWSARLNLSNRDLEKLYYVFMRYDQGEGLSVADFCRWLGEDELNELCQEMASFVEPHDKGYLSFPELLETVCVFSQFSHSQIVTFIHRMLDPDRTKFVPIDVLKAFVTKSHRGDGSFQINHGIKNLVATTKHGLVSVDELVSFDKQFPFLLYPSFKPQMAIIKNSYGEKFWDIKRNMVVDEAEVAARMARKREKKGDLEDDGEVDSEFKVRQRMTDLWYYLTPWQRPKYRRQLLRIAAISKELDEEVDRIWAVTKPHFLTAEFDLHGKGKDEDEEEDLAAGSSAVTVTVKTVKPKPKVTSKDTEEADERDEKDKDKSKVFRDKPAPASSVPPNPSTATAATDPSLSGPQIRPRPPNGPPGGPILRPKVDSSGLEARERRARALEE